MKKTLIIGSLVLLLSGCSNLPEQLTKLEDNLQGTSDLVIPKNELKLSDIQVNDHVEEKGYYITKDKNSYLTFYDGKLSIGHYLGNDIDVAKAFIKGFDFEISEDLTKQLFHRTAFQQKDKPVCSKFKNDKYYIMIQTSPNSIEMIVYPTTNDKIKDAYLSFPDLQESLNDIAFDIAMENSSVQKFYDIELKESEKAEENQYQKEKRIKDFKQRQFDIQKSFNQNLNGGDGIWD